MAFAITLPRIALVVLIEATPQASAFARELYMPESMPGEPAAILHCAGTSLSFNALMIELDCHSLH